MKATILVVDDVLENLWVLSGILGEAGYDVRPVTGGPEALEVAALACPDLVLLDIRMPGMDGFETCRRLKEDLATRDIPVIFLSASSDLQDKLAAFHNGGVDYITKPFQDGEVLARVRTHLHLRTVQTELEAARATLELRVAERTEALTRSEMRYRRLVERSPNIIYSFSDRRGLQYVNARVADVLGHSPAALLTEPALWHAGVHPEDAPLLADALAGLRDGCGYDLEYRVRDTAGAWHWFHDRSITVHTKPDEAVVDGLIADITQSRTYLGVVEHLAYHDALTELPNRKRMEQCIDRRLAEGGPFALLLLDLDRFKEINDALGHPAGDELIVQVALRLRACIGVETGLVARLGGDEFAIVLTDADRAAAERRTAEVLSALAPPFSLKGLRIKVSASLGIACAPQDGTTAAALLASADMAMYAAKRRLGRYSFYAQEMSGHSPFLLELLSQFEEAVDAGQLTLHYQPKMDVRNGTIAGVEALVRWNHPQHGLLMPGRFLPMVEVSDLVVKLTRWVIAAAGAQSRAWRDQGLDIAIAVNLSARNVVDESLPDFIRQILEEHAIPDGALELEITETAMMVDPERAIGILDRIVRLKVGLAIDDFGTGYSSFALVRRIPALTTLKIDRSFVDDLCTNPVDGVVVASMVALAEGLGIPVVAEGVEDAATLDRLRRTGCHQVQGYHVARPMEAGAVRDWIARHRPERFLA